MSFRLYVVTGERQNEIAKMLTHWVYPDGPKLVQALQASQSIWLSPPVIAVVGIDNLDRLAALRFYFQSNMIHLHVKDSNTTLTEIADYVIE